MRVHAADELYRLRHAHADADGGRPGADLFGSRTRHRVEIVAASLAENHPETCGWRRVDDAAWQLRRRAAFACAIQVQVG